MIMLNADIYVVLPVMFPECCSPLLHAPSPTSDPLKETLNLPRLRVQINVVESGSSGQTRHGRHVTDQGVNEGGTGGQTNPVDGQRETGGNTLLLYLATCNEGNPQRIKTMISIYAPLFNSNIVNVTLAFSTRVLSSCQILLRKRHRYREATTSSPSLGLVCPTVPLMW